MLERAIAIETSSRRGSVALGENERLVAVADFTADLRHASELLPAIEALRGQAGWERSSIRQVYISIGPGSFTGLRVAVTTARHLALALGARIVAVPSLAVIADNARHAASPPEHLAVVLDAKRNEVYAGLFRREADAYAAAGPPVVAEPGAWLAGLPRPLAVMGEGVGYHEAAVRAAGVDVLDDALALPRAESVYRMGLAAAKRGEFTPAHSLVPLYLRRPEAEEVWEKRQGGAPG